MKKLMLAMVVLSGIALYAPSCYNNKADIVLPDSTISFTKSVVPIYVSGGCGCHNTVKPTNTTGSDNAVRFSNGGYNGKDTILYDVILGKTSLIESWINGGKHPGGGDVYLTPQEISVLRSWINQGSPDDRSSGGTPTNVTYSNTIQAMVSSTCAGGSCHTGLGPTLTFAKLVGDKDKLTSMVSSKGTSGHPGGKLTLGSSTWAAINAWLSAGMPQ
ncbi:hypothetical protein [Pinibacter aurantiacus]|uniref:Cytochrome C Planctomycete-type domain-containing protein n=1 Tax=Pinibacter aurantiacus TaxID=2851599 RepID=A0A9E2SDR5_9BACT|nr:hypothetical protein [Pinibacter aurantiacus]MBV4359769.1 hypothetical protein [Pinibacter aurantiacus]